MRGSRRPRELREHAFGTTAVTKRDTLELGERMIALEIVKYAYLAALICILIVEIVPTWRIARPSALAAIFLATVGGSAWAYAAYHTPGAWPEFEYEKQARSDAGGGGRSAQTGRADGGNGRGGQDGAAASASGSASDIDGDGDGAGDGGATQSVPQRFAAASTAAGAAAERAAHHVAGALGLAALPDPKPVAGDTIKDCSDCPGMVIVPPGETRIGAEESDPEASAAERPARSVKVWPGFAMTRAVISAQSMARFREETRRPAPACAAQSADAGANAAAIHSDAACLTVDDADAYALWLSNRTGKRYRLPSAIEWEHALRVLAPGTFKTGEAREIVDDCWQDKLPKAGFEILSSHGRTVECEVRMLKGAMAAEEARWNRPSVRRPVFAKQAAAGLGFRLVRDLDP